MPAKEHEQTADDLDAVAHQHDLAFGVGIGKSAHKRRQNHIKQREHRHQRGLLPLGRLRAAQQLHGSYKQGVVGQRAEELRRHDGEKSALHPVVFWFAVLGGVGVQQSEITVRGL